MPILKLNKSEYGKKQKQKQNKTTTKKTPKLTLCFIYLLLSQIHANFLSEQFAEESVLNQVMGSNPRIPDWSFSLYFRYL